MRQERETQRERDREREKLFECISDKDKAIQDLEVTLARVTQETKNLAKRSNDAVSELNMQVR